MILSRMSSMNDLISRVLLPNTVEDLKRRLDSGRVSGWYESNSNRLEAEKKKSLPEKSDDHRKSHSSTKESPCSLSKEINDKYSSITENSDYVNRSNGENLFWDELKKVIKDKVQCPDCGKVFFNEVKLPENFLKILSNFSANKESNVNNSTPSAVPTILPSLPKTTEPQRFECTICDRVFSLKENYAKHLRKHFNTKSSSKNKCELCGRTFSNQTSLLNHFVDHKANTCEECGKTFPDKWKFERHSKTHLHKCHLCGKLFVKKYYLQKHMINTHKVFDFDPNQKPKQQKNSNNCKMIVSVKPEGDEVSNALVMIKAEEPAVETAQNSMAIVPYVAKPVSEYKNKCHICGKSYKDKWKLKQHLIIHSGERAWACTYCTQKFYFKYGLSRHVKNVHLAKEQAADVHEATKKDNLKQE